MNTLLHICCAPCANQCIDVLRTDGCAVTGYWYNPNIHPFTEYRSRRNCLRDYAASIIHGRRVLCKHTKSGVEICGKFRLRTHKKCGSMYQIPPPQKPETKGCCAWPIPTKPTPPGSSGS